MTKDLTGDRQTFRQADRETTDKSEHRPTDRHKETTQLQIDRP